MFLKPLMHQLSYQDTKELIVKPSTMCWVQKEIE
jgi:hypothetical protein